MEGHAYWPHQSAAQRKAAWSWGWAGRVGAGFLALGGAGTGLRQRGARPRWAAADRRRVHWRMPGVHTVAARTPGTASASLELATQTLRRAHACARASAVGDGDDSESRSVVLQQHVVVKLVHEGILAAKVPPRCGCQQPLAHSHQDVGPGQGLCCGRRQPLAPLPAPGCRARMGREMCMARGWPAAAGLAGAAGTGPASAPLALAGCRESGRLRQQQGSGAPAKLGTHLSGVRSCTLMARATRFLSTALPVPWWCMATTTVPCAGQLKALIYLLGVVGRNVGDDFTRPARLGGGAVGPPRMCHGGWGCSGAHAGACQVCSSAKAPQIEQKSPVCGPFDAPCATKSMVGLPRLNTFPGSEQIETYTDGKLSPRSTI